MNRLLITFLFTLGAVLSATAQNLVLYDDFEGGTGLWQTTGWGLTQSFSFSPTHSFTESPFGNYPDDTVLTATTITGANLTPYLGARLDLQARWVIEQGFDFCHIEASRDGSFWVPLGSLTGENTTWQLLQYDLGAFAGLANVRLRFRFVSDILYSFDGACLDNVAVWGLPDDQTGPLILHRGPVAYHGEVGNNSLFAEIWDASGISQEHLYYRLDGGAFMESPQDSVIGENYYHTIPSQEAGTLVEYFFQAADGAIPTHFSVSDTFAYLAGRMLIWDDGVSEDILEGPPGTRGAVRFEGQEAGYVTSALVRIYTDLAHPLDSVKVYVWADSSGLPGPVLAGPFEIWPASTPDDPEAWTWVDLRPAALTAPDTFHVGVELGATGMMPSGALSLDEPARFLRSSEAYDQGWQAADYGDFHIRVVVGEFTPNAVPALPVTTPLPTVRAVICPNPTNGAMKIVLSGRHSGGEIRLALYDLLGRVISRWREQLMPEQTSLKLAPSPALAAGIYVLEIGFGEGLQPIRLKVVYLP